MAEPQTAAASRVAATGQDVLLATKLPCPACSLVWYPGRAWWRRSEERWSAR
jgi:hypothetical protein